MNVRRSIQCLLACAAVALINTPASARAEGYVNPWAGVNFGNEDARKGLHSFGVSLGDTGNKTGLDASLGYTSDFTGSGGPKVLDLMGGLTMGPRFGRGTQTLRPYVAGNIGLLRTSIGDFAKNDFGFNLGGGLFAYFSTHLGVRGEVRYFRTLNGDDLGEFHFTRAQFGLLLR